jgi:hypothetical protein
MTTDALTKVGVKVGVDISDVASAWLTDHGLPKP